MKEYFFNLSKEVFSHLQGNEWGELYLSAENSDFVRINQSKIRQPGNVQQVYITVRLGKGQKKLSTTLSLSSHLSSDSKILIRILSELRDELDQVPNDPFLVKIENTTQQSQEITSVLPAPIEILDQLLSKSQSLDLVGLYTCGDLYRGFSNSFGQRNWFSTKSFQLDWSLFYQKDISLKSSWMGRNWEPLGFEKKWASNLEQFEMIKRPRKSLNPGQYRVYLSPSALEEMARLLAWGAFSIQTLKNKTSPLLQLAEGEEGFHSNLSICEETSLGVSPNFNAHGEKRPDNVTLVDQGRYNQSLVSSRSAKEYKLISNAAEDHEQPQSLSIGAGTLPMDKVLETLDTGIYINNLWYLNYSDRRSCKATGMTRFATFWVENGRIQYPIQVLRFDQSLFHALGSNLEALTSERELLLSTDTYNERKPSCFYLPGAIVNNFSFSQ